MTLQEAELLSQFTEELSKLLDHCSTRDQLYTHFSRYLVGELTARTIEDYDFTEEITNGEMIVRVQICFPWEPNIEHEIIIVKTDNPNAAYDRAMGVI